MAFSEQTVRTSDGVALHVEVEGPSDSGLTIVFVHGFTARLEEFDLQRDALRGETTVRRVFYDHRGHGRSGGGRPKLNSIDQLSMDLHQVLQSVASTGRVVLLGHSMGGMAVLALARQHPELFGSQVAGVFLLATSAGNLVRSGPLGYAIRLLARLQLLGAYLLGLRLAAPLLERVRRRGSALGRVFYRRYLFGADDADADLVAGVQELLERTPLTTAAAFYPTFITHDETAALPVVGRLPVTVLVGGDDRLTPASHSRAMADRIGPNCRLVVVPGAGHSVNVTRPDLVNAEVLALLGTVETRAA